MTTYGDITPRTAAYAVDKMLTRAQPQLNMARFAVVQSIPKGRTKVCKWRKYGRLAPSTTALTEGVTPTAGILTNTDVTATLSQYGQFVNVTDVILDTHEDPVLNEFSESMGETAGQTQEAIIYATIKAGTNVLYANGTTRAGITSVLSSTVVRKGIRALRQQDARFVTSMVNATDGVGTVPIPACYVSFCHPNVEMDLQNTSNFAAGLYTRVQNYGSFKPISDAELGTFENTRFLASTLYTPFADGGGTLGSNLGSTASDVYPTLMVGKESFATVNLAGGNGLTPIVYNPKPGPSDQLAQKGHVGFKMYMTAAILNDAWMVRIEHAVTA